MKDEYRTERNEWVFIKYAKPKILRRGKQNIKQIYNDIFLPAFYKQNFDCKPISEKTMYKYVDRLIDPDERIGKQEGRVAKKHSTSAKIGHIHQEGFRTLVEVDAYHEPIALLDPVTFKPTKTRPIHYLAVETFINAYTGWITDYEYGAERSSLVVELYKHMMLPNKDFQQLYGTKHPHISYCKPSMLKHDGGKAFIADLAFEFIRLSNTISGLTKTQEGKGKPFVESGNFNIKRQFTFTLPGHYNDAQKEYVDTQHYSKFAILTTLEHQVLFNRYIIDKHNYGYDKKRNINRAEQWTLESEDQPHALPDNNQDLLFYEGIKDTKKIQTVVGIQFHVNGKTYTFNSKKLQKLRRVLVSRKLEVEVFYHRSDFFPKEIKVVNPISDELLIVPIVEKDEEAEIPFVGDGEFYAKFAKLQTLERLSRLSDEQIIAEAEARDRTIKEYKKQKKLASAENAKTVEDMLQEDSAIIEAAMNISHAEGEDDEKEEESFEQLVNSDKVDSTSTYDTPDENDDDSVEGEDWGDSISFGGNNE